MQVGIDLGSRTIKVAVVEDGRMIDYRIAESGFDPHGQALEMIKQYKPSKIVATGYGRHLAQKHFAHDVITEIKAHAIGARYHFPECTTVVDIGGQDSKVISLGANGSVVNFQMNDKCAAGTGRFLEIMATSLGFALDEFGPAALESDQEVAINSMRTVFAESEVVSMKNRGIPPKDVANAVHLSVVNRLTAMLNRVGFGESIVFSGGVARNPCIVKMLQERLDCVKVESPSAPDIVGALGAALYADRC
ncbi:MAG: 3-hydroxyacyl-ACP dehydratase [Desulfobulbaceae bacterium]|uniref:3-hydroxyacyl-ACP dehydratase n=1 Tax=Candidatus Desulfobia pelagia TaxID=2841692 RepID=A0A8J6NF60_9BACT|nr:3-hydroxyacyl-ACP dehydratase [Candidatus Desulfobia pelagia]